MSRRTARSVFQVGGACVLFFLIPLSEGLFGVGTEKERDPRKMLELIQPPAVDYSPQIPSAHPVSEEAKPPVSLPGPKPAHSRQAPSKTSTATLSIAAGSPTADIASLASTPQPSSSTAAGGSPLKPDPAKHPVPASAAVAVSRAQSEARPPVLPKPQTASAVATLPPVAKASAPAPGKDQKSNLRPPDMPVPDLKQAVMPQAQRAVSAASSPVLTGPRLPASAPVSIPPAKGTAATAAVTAIAPPEPASSASSASADKAGTAAGTGNAANAELELSPTAQEAGSQSQDTPEVAATPVQAEPSGENAPAEAVLRKAREFHEVGSFKKMLALLEENQELVGDSPEAAALRLEQLMKEPQPDYRMLRSVANIILQSDEKNADANFAMGLYLVNQRKPDLGKALQHLGIAKSGRKPPSGAASLYWRIFVKNYWYLFLIPLMVIVAAIDKRRKRLQPIAGDDAAPGDTGPQSGWRGRISSLLGIVNRFRAKFRRSAAESVSGSRSEESPGDSIPQNSVEEDVTKAGEGTNKPKF